jgi:glycosyltransferase involved in cell wall biosynthesis
MADRPALAVVVQRYGPQVTGGSESLARAVAERLAAQYRVIVFTTCALDYVSWRNELAPGTEVVDGVEIRRFPVEEERDLAAFNRFSDTLYGRPHRREDELEWLRRQGPYVPALVRALAASRGGFHATMFFTYLYYPTFWGLEAAAEHSVLVPTAHDEPPLRFEMYREMFARPRAFAFLTSPEEALVRSRFPLAGRPARVAGIGVEALGAPDVAAFRSRHEVADAYVLYAGRIDAGKGCAEMVEFYERCRAEYPQAPDLLLIGKLAMPLPEVKGVRYLGYLPEPEKAAAMAGAELVLCPSPYESLSIVLLEAFALGVPGLVNGRSAVLQDHCRRANGGLYYSDADEFVEAFGLLVRDRALRHAMGENARRYVRENYRWDVVLARYGELIEAAARSPSG